MVMTSNLGSGKAGLEQVGFLGGGEKDLSGKALRAHFSPEFLGRLDSVVVFRALSAESLQKIAEKELRETIRRAEASGASLTVGADVAEWLAERCAKGQSGAREVRKKIRSEIEAPLAQRILEAEGKICLTAAVEQGSIVIRETL